MNCEMISKLIPGYLDNELDLQSIIKFESHVDACGHCRNELNELRHLRNELRHKMSYYQAPDAFRVRLQQSLDNIAEKDKKPERVKSIFRNRISPKLVTALATLFLAINLGLFWSLPSKQDRLAEEVVADHIRSLLTDHLTDVASSDRHTVKPWFNGKLNFAPQVLDLATQGFTLVGGRLDYLDARTVTALVYRRRQHVINVFIWPDNASEIQTAYSGTRNGYNLLSFKSHGMIYWIVSDLNVKELTEFKKLFL